MLDIHFASDADCRGWSPIDDRIMGGVSRSRVEYSGSGTGLFRGDLSLEQGGGFASVRMDTPGLDLRGCDSICLRVRGDGKRYKVSLRSTANFDDVLYQSSFVAPAAWVTVDLPLDGFVATFRGRKIDDAPPIDVSRVATIGLMISGKQAGPFCLEIESIGCRRAAP
jgi:hypothetical protein